MADEKLRIIISAKDQASKALGSVGNALSGIGKAAGAGAAVFLGATATMGAGLAKLAIDAAPLEGIQGAFAGIATGSGQSSAALLSALTTASAGMISNRDLMTSYNQAAQLVGVTFANQLPDAMGYLSKVSAATGTDMGFMLDSLVKGVGRLSPMILDNLGIQVSLEQATARAAEMFGVETDALTKTQIQAGMMDVVLAQLAANTANMPEVAGTAAAGFAAIGTSMQNLKDSIGLQLLPVMQPFLTTLTSIATTYGPQVVAIFGQFATTLGVTVPQAALLINDALTRMNTVFTGSKEPISLMDTAMGVLKMTLDAGIIAVQLIAVAAQELAGAMEAVKNAVEAVSAAINAGTEAWNAFWAAAGAGANFVIGGGGEASGGVTETATGTSQYATSATAGTVVGGTMYGYASGGVVPGAVGQAQLAVVHGGETITPAGQSSTIENNLTITLDGEVVGRYLGRKTAQMQRLGGYAAL